MSCKKEKETEDPNKIKEAYFFVKISGMNELEGDKVNIGLYTDDTIIGRTYMSVNGIEKSYGGVMRIDNISLKNDTIYEIKLSRPSKYLNIDIRTENYGAPFELIYACSVNNQEVKRQDTLTFSDNEKYNMRLEFAD